MALVRELTSLRETDVARLGDVAVFLGNLSLLHGLGTGTRVSIRSRLSHDAFDEVFCVLPIAFFTRALCMPFISQGYPTAVPDLCFASKHDLPTLTLTVPPGYASFVRYASWELLGWAFCHYTGRRELFTTWWTELTASLLYPGLHVDMDEDLRSLLDARGRLVDADWSAMAAPFGPVDLDTQAKLYAIWDHSICARTYASLLCQELFSPQHAIAVFERVRPYVTISVRPANPPALAPEAESLYDPFGVGLSPFEGTIRVTFRWLTVLLVELAGLLKKPDEPVRKRLDLSSKVLDELLTAIDATCTVLQTFPPADLASFPPTEDEVELVLDLYRSVSPPE